MSMQEREMAEGTNFSRVLEGQAYVLTEQAQIPKDVVIDRFDAQGSGPGGESPPPELEDEPISDILRQKLS